MNDICKTQQSFARKAQAQPEHRFGDMYHLICGQEWLNTALEAVLRNKGSQTAGMDGINRQKLEEETAQNKFVKELQLELKAKSYQPQPVCRQWIPKANGKLRPLGIPTLKDRVVQMALKMLLEPIWESDFLDCSNGFRPGRRTMDCLCTCRSRITTQNKYLWVIEGDIKGCFDNIQHPILLELIDRRIKDQAVINLIKRMLQAGVIDQGRYHPTPTGTPQGGVLSPLLTNIYLHEFDCWWWEKYGKLTLYQKANRRKAGIGNCILTRYADDFVILCNGPRAEVERLREEARQFLWEVLRLEMSLDKSRITHVTDGFDFLGFHLQWKLPKSGKPWLQVTPSQKSIDRFKHTVKTMTRRNTFYQAPLDKIKSLNRVMRGWNQYYEYANATHIASQLTYWANDRLFLWLKKRHKRGARWVLKTYRHREQRGQTSRWNLGITDEKGQMVYLYHLTDLHRRSYYARQYPHPYLVDQPSNLDPELETPFVERWDGHTTPEKAEWFEIRLAVLARDDYRCTECGRKDNLHVHHNQARREGGTHQMDNLQTLCLQCHAQTMSWGRPSGTGRTQSGRAG
jgi:group II intron reverse transcriptase/maturase